MALPPSFTFGASPDMRLSFSPDNLPSMDECLQPRQPVVTEHTLTKSFSFEIPQIYKVTKPSLLQWLDGVPTPAEHPETEGPSEAYQHQKRNLDHDMSSDGCGDDDHRQKRAKLRMSWGGHPGLPAPVQKSKQDPNKPKKGFFRRLSNVYQRVVTPSSKGTDEPSELPPVGTSSRPTSCLIPVGRPQMKFVFVGDAKCGKSSLLLRSKFGIFPQSPTSTHFDLYAKNMVVDNQLVSVEIWDTAGNIDLHQLEKLSYLNWDAVFLCFNLTSQRSLQNAYTKWLKEIRAHCKNAPMILVGLKKDERSNTGLWTPFYRGARITAGDGAMAANAMGAVMYVECSAKTGEGISGVLEQGVRSAFKERAAYEEAEAKKIQDSGLSMEDLTKRVSQALCFD